MRRAAELLRERADKIAAIMTIEQGKVLTEARLETLAAAEIIEWFAEEGRLFFKESLRSRHSGKARSSSRLDRGSDIRATFEVLLTQALLARLFFANHRASRRCR